MKRHRTRGPTGLIGLAALLLVVALAVGACAKPAPQAPAATTTAVQQPTAAPTSAPANTPASKPAATSNLPAGVDAEGNFYRGDPKASVKLIEFSDFQ